MTLKKTNKKKVSVLQPGTIVTISSPGTEQTIIGKLTRFEIDVDMDHPHPDDAYRYGIKPQILSKDITLRLSNIEFDSSKKQRRTRK